MPTQLISVSTMILNRMTYDYSNGFLMMPNGRVEIAEPAEVTEEYTEQKRTELMLKINRAALHGCEPLGQE